MHSEILTEGEDTVYPPALKERLGDSAPPSLYSMGNLDILKHWRLGLLCSIRCPGSVILKTFDAIHELRDAGIVVVGGFHSPMERECLDLFLRGSQPVIVCPARSLIGLRIKEEGRHALKEGRLLVLSIFGPDIRRTTLVQTTARNEFVAAMADVLFIPHASGAVRLRLLGTVRSNGGRSS